MRTFAALTALPESYLTLLSQAGRENFFLSRAWFFTFIDTMVEAGAAPRIYGVESSAGEPQILLFARTPAGQNGSMLRCGPLTSRTLASLTNYQTNVFAPIVSNTVADPVSSFLELGQYLVGESPRWQVLDFNYLDAVDPATGWMTEALRQPGLATIPYFHCNNWYEPTEGHSWKSYLKNRSSSVQKAIQNYARKGRKLERTGTVRYEIYKRPGDLPRALADYERVYRSSWKEPEPFPGFVPRLFHAAADAGALRLGILYFNDEPLATEVAIVSNGRAAMVKTAYDERYREYSVGSLIIMYVMEHLLDAEQVREIEFGAFDAPYKALWVSHTRELRGIVSFNTRTARGLYAMAYHHGWHAARAVKTRIRRTSADAAPTKK